MAVPTGASLTQDFPVLFLNAPSVVQLRDFTAANHQESHLPVAKKRRCRQLAPGIAAVTGISLDLIPIPKVHFCSDQYHYLRYVAVFCAMSHIYARIEHFKNHPDQSRSPDKIFAPLIRDALEYTALAPKSSKQDGIGELSKTLEEKLAGAPQGANPEYWMEAGSQAQDLIYHTFVRRYVNHTHSSRTILMRSPAEKLLIDRWLQEAWQKCEFGVGPNTQLTDVETGQAVQAYEGALEGNLSVSPSQLRNIAQSATQAIILSDMASMMQSQNLFALSKLDERSIRREQGSRPIDQAQLDREVGWHEQLKNHIMQIGCRILGLEPEQSSYAAFLQLSSRYRTEHDIGMSPMEFMDRLRGRDRTY